MKKLLLIALAAIAMFSFNSCKKDDGRDDPKPKEMRYVKNITWKELGSNGSMLQSHKIEFEYDNQHRLMKGTVINLPENTINRIWNFVYIGNTVTVSYPDPNTSFECQLNDMGYLLSNPNDEGDASYTYDANGYLQTVSYGSTNTTISVHWENGNYIRQEYNGGEPETYEYASMLHPNVNLNLNGEEILSSARYAYYNMDSFLPCGRHTTNLMLKRKLKDGKYSSSTDYTYTLDQDGYVTLIIGKETTSDERIITAYAEITYN